MFTGLVQGVGQVVGCNRGSSGMRLGIDCSSIAAGISPGDSICVSGVCLTVVAFDGIRCEFDVVPQTMEVTTLGSLARGDRVNLERSLRLGDPLGGHLVQGHVDGTGVLTGIITSGGQHRLRVSLPASLASLVAPRGSIALDGVSLTVADCQGEWLEVALIPETLARTTLSGRRAGDLLNVEVDQLARLVSGALARELARRGL